MYTSAPLGALVVLVLLFIIGISFADKRRSYVTNSFWSILHAPLPNGKHPPMKKIHRLGFAALLLATVLLSPSTVLAQPSMGLKISPTLIEEKVEPGQVNAYVLRVENPGDTTLHLFTVAKDIVGVGPDGRPIYARAEEENTYRLSSWVTFKEKDLTLGPGESGVVHVTVKIPSDVSPGGHFGSLALTQEGPKDVPIGTGVGFELGAILSLQVAGEVVEDTRFRSFSASQMVYGSPEAHFSVRLENLGNVAARPQGIIDIMNMWGKKVASIPVNEGAAGVFPKSTRDFTAVWTSEDLEFGRYEAFAAFSVPGTKGNPTITATTQFWVLPIKVLYPAAGGLLVFVLILWIMIRFYVGRQLAAHGVGGRRLASRREASGLSRFASVVIALLVAVILGLIILFLYFG